MSPRHESTSDIWARERPQVGKQKISVKSNGWILILVVVSLAALAFGLSLQPTAQAAQSPQLQVLQSDTNHIVLELDTPAYDGHDQTVGSTTYTVITVPGFGNTGEEGKPELPIKGAVVGIPPGAKASLQVISDQSSIATLSRPVLPVPTTLMQHDYKQTLPSEAGKSFKADGQTYSTNASYPAGVAKIASIRDWRSQRIATIELHPLQYNPVLGQLVFHRRLRVQINLSYPNGVTKAALGSAVDEGPFEAVLERAITNYSSAKGWRATNRAVMTPRLPSSPTPGLYTGGPWYKIGVNYDGIYAVTCAQIAAAAGKTLFITPTTLQVFKNGQEVAIKVVGSTWSNCTTSDTGDYVEFYGQAPISKYANTNMYWLTYGQATGKRMAGADSTGIGSVPSSFTDTIHLEENHLYRSYAPMVEGADHWFWAFASQAFGLAPTFALPIPNPATSPYSATLQVDLTAFTTLGHHTQLYMNGNLLGDLVWSGPGEQKFSFQFPGSYLAQGANSIQVSEPNDQDPNDVICINNFDVDYQSAFAAKGDSLAFKESDSGIWNFQISGYSSPSLEAYDITDPFSVARFNTLSVTPSSPSYTLSFTATIAAPHQYIALTSAQRKTPTSVALDSSATPNLHANINGADEIIISYGGFINDVMPLANYRVSQGLRVKVVDVQDVYDEFSDGLVDPQGIRDFLAYAYSNWQAPAPSFVLLVGDGHLDAKEYCTTPGICQAITTTPNTEFIPPYLLLIDPYIGETDADNRFVAFGGNNTLPYLAIGRLPADSSADVDAMVNKILNYEQNPAHGNWQTNVTFVADQPDPNAGDFWQQSELVASNPAYMPAQYTSNRVYYTSPSYPNAPSAHQGVIQSINTGSLIMNYVGHSYWYYWSKAPLLCAYADGFVCNGNDFSSLTNGNMTPVFVEMTCFTGYFIWPNIPSSAEVNLRTAAGGGVASWAATGEGLSTGHYLLDEGFFNAVMQQGVYQLGPATILGKLDLWANSGGAYHDLIDTFQLFGDPATQLLAPKTDVAITKTVSSKGPLMIGSPITFTLKFSNNGGGRAERVVITDIIPSQVLSPTFVSSGVPITTTGATPYAWNVGSLDPGAGGVITITGTLDPNPSHYAGLSLINNSTISTATNETDTSNDQSSTTTILIVPSPTPTSTGTPTRTPTRTPTKTSTPTSTPFKILLPIILKGAR